MNSLSLALPVHNEEDNILALHQEILEALCPLGIDYEIIWVNDGSTDTSAQKIDSLCQEDKRNKAIHFRTNFGQTAAMAAGLTNAKNDIVIFMDADRQNDPQDIPQFLEKIKEGYDVVVGHRKNRQDKHFSRIIPSMIANAMIRSIGGVQVQDLGCSLKAFRRELIQEVNLYGEMHRFIPLYTTAIGGKLTEIVVNHRPRVAGKTKYGLMRTYKVLLDLITVKFLMSYLSRPMHFFGASGLVLFIMSFLSALLLLVHKFVDHISIIQSPLLILSAVLLILACNFILMGLLAEVMIRVYFDGHKHSSYSIKRKCNF